MLTELMMISIIHRPNSDFSQANINTAEHDENHTSVSSFKLNSGDQGDEAAHSQFEWVVGDPPREEEESDEDSISSRTPDEDLDVALASKAEAEHAEGLYGRHQQFDSNDDPESIQPVEDSSEPQQESDSGLQAEDLSGELEFGQPIEEALLEEDGVELSAVENTAGEASEEPRSVQSNEDRRDMSAGDEIRQAGSASVEVTQRGEWYTPSLFELSPDSQTVRPRTQAGQDGQSSADAMGFPEETFFVELRTDKSADSEEPISNEITGGKPGYAAKETSELSDQDSRAIHGSGAHADPGVSFGSNSRIEQLIQSGIGGAARLADVRLRPITDIKKGLGLNEKFLLMRSFFNNDAMRFTADLDRLNRLGSLAEAEKELFDSLMPGRSWDAQSEADITLLLVIYRRFCNC
jgi:hypothetical protein